MLLKIDLRIFCFLMIWFEKEFTWLSVSCQVCFWKITSAQLKLWQLQFIFFSQKILASPLQKQFINISLSLRKSDAPAVFQVRWNIWRRLGFVPTNYSKEKWLLYLPFCDKKVWIVIVWLLFYKTIRYIWILVQPALRLFRQACVPIRPCFSFMTTMHHVLWL